MIKAKYNIDCKVKVILIHFRCKFIIQKKAMNFIAFNILCKDFKYQNDHLLIRQVAFPIPEHRHQVYNTYF